MRSLLRKMVLDILSIASKPSSSVHILNGHFIEEQESDLSEQHFEMFITEMMKYFQIIGLDEAVSLIEENKKINSPKVALTFDDGFLECYDRMLPVLEKNKIKATFFINPRSIDNQNESFASEFIRNNLNVNLSKKFMNWDMIREIHSLGHIIGSHTVSHADLKGLSALTLNEEVQGAKKIIEKEINNSCDYFAFPFGNSNYFDDKAIEAVNKFYKYGFTSGLYSNCYHEGNKQILSRRHFECNWPIKHIRYFTSGKRKLE